jgi:phytoene synthase
VTPLDRSYRHCATLSRRHGSSYYWSTKLLPRADQRHVHALYALARTADDIVDLPSVDGRQPAEALAAFADRFFADLDLGRSDDPALQAVVDTVGRFELDRSVFERFFGAMEMDLTVASYEDWEDLLVYMDGSAAVIGEMMLPILRPLDSVAAFEPARDLGLAFQLTNFLRDIAEDLDRGRQYLPQHDLRRFGVDLGDRRVTPEFVTMMRFEIDRCRALYRSAEAGIELLPRRSANCIRAAHTVYGEILDQIERSGYDVFAGRARVPALRKLALTARQLIG